MIEAHKRNPFLSWFVGLVFIVAGVVYVGWRMHATECGAPLGAEFIILVAVPVIYATLMYLTLKSQD